MEFTRNDKTSAVNYSIYMIASSYFHSAKCLDGGREANCHLIYRLMGITEQYRMEDAVITLMEKRVLKFLPKPFQSADVRVNFLKNNKGILISGLGYELEISPVKVGKDLLFSWCYQDKMEGAIVKYEPEIQKKRPANKQRSRLVA